MSASLSTPPMSSVLGVIERKLRELWKSEPGELARTRVCTMNLVVITGSSDIADHYVSVVDEVSRISPARAILVSMDPAATENLLDGDVTAVGGDQAAFSERVRLHASGGACSRVGSAIEALLVPEIPTTLVWLGRVHVDDPLFIELAEYAERIVLDTDYTSLSSLVTLARWAREEHARPGIADLAWTRVAIWQEMCARFFDDPRARTHAHAIERLTVEQASEKGARIGSEGALLVGWLATRLGWKIERLGGTLRFRRPDGGRVMLQLAAVPRQEGVAPLALAGVRFESKHAGESMRGEIVRELASGAAIHAETPDADVLRWRASLGDAPPTEQLIRMGANKGARLLDRVLRKPRTDAALAEAVFIAEELNDDGVVCA